MTRDHLLGWHHHAQLIADSMPAPIRPSPVRLVPVTERVGVADVDPAPRSFFGFDLAAMPEPDQRLGEMAQHAQELLQGLCGVSGDALIGFKQEKPAAAPTAALGEWIDCGPDMPDIPEGQYQLRAKRISGFGEPWTPGEGDGFSGRWSLRRNVHAPQQIAAHQYRLLPKEPA